ncbi:MAG: glycerol-3-phosphate dehydrogenase/oxidase [Candidatus Lokiarchaeota archaeon]|nr:glycerol-3-phosphate dehydrogenase/oxidase [Candidatus Lokiarchaeota archaeon]
MNEVKLEPRLFDESWNFKNRDHYINNLQETEYDIFVIGAGITGAGVAREATMRGLRVAIVDMQDFAGGTSSRSSKLGHGGIRYLSHGDIDLVKEALHERNWMRVHIPHLIRPIPFLFVELEGGKYKKRDIKGAAKLYDFLSDKDSEFKNYKPFQMLSPEEIFKIEPHYIKEGVLGGAVYYDTNLDDARLTLETIKEAVIRGADAVSYCKVISYFKDNGKIIGVNCMDLENNYNFRVKAKLVINATGVWTDNLLESYPDEIPKPLIRPTKGVHLQYRRKNIKNNNAAIVFSKKDGRAFFVLPRDEDFTIIGTTDTDYKGELVNPYCSKEDADYLIESTNYYFPNAQISYENILSTYAGIRPLVMQKGKSESDISRKHIIIFSDDGLLTITGGKLTEWRAMAEDLFNHILEKNYFPKARKPKDFSKQPFIIGFNKNEWLKKLKQSGINIESEVADHIYQQYGKGAIKILELIKGDHLLGDRILKDNNFIKAEIVYTLRYEMTLHLIDVFCRRTEMALWINHKEVSKAAHIVADLMQKEYLWDDEIKLKEISQYLDYIEKTVAFMK